MKDTRRVATRLPSSSVGRKNLSHKPGDKDLEMLIVAPLPIVSFGLRSDGQFTTSASETRDEIALISSVHFSTRKIVPWVHKVI